tara:strand:+ start:748 stop:1209 length:462 start_codon:yes stop_codon:yes gene_type:complete
MVGITQPSNKILIKGDPAVVEYKATDAAIKPGDMVKFKTSDAEIDEGGAPTGSTAMGIGVAGYEQAHEAYKPATRATAYADDAMIPVILAGSGCLVMAAVSVTGKSGGTLARGDPLTGSAAAGELVIATIGTNHIYGVLMNNGATTLGTVLLL